MPSTNLRWEDTCSWTLRNSQSRVCLFNYLFWVSCPPQYRQAHCVLSSRSSGVGPISRCTYIHHCLLPLDCLRESSFFFPQKHLIEFCYTVAQKYIFEGKHEDAVPAALHSLRFRMSVHGMSSVELVPAYLLLAEASLGKWNWLETPWSL